MNLVLKTCLVIGLLLNFTTCHIEIEELNDKYTEAVRLINTTLNEDSDFKSHAYNTVAYIVDTYGPRLWGSEALEDAIIDMRNRLVEDAFEDVKLEKVPIVKKWKRGEERLTLFSPRPYPTKIPMIGLGKSVGGNVTAEVVLIRGFDDLEAKGKAGLLQGKIALYNYDWTFYRAAHPFRSSGPSRAAKFGAVGCIIRSVASKSIESPHTGTTTYDEKYKKIPAAAVSVESADMFERMIRRGQKVVLNLYMEAKYTEGGVSHNLIGDIKGSQYPDEVIIVGGHIDSWDTGPQTGANDDAGGFMVCYEAVRTLLKLGLRPKRTIRFIAWSGEEMTEPTNGAATYVKDHRNEMENHLLVFESDLGTTDIYGFGFTGGKTGFGIIENIANTYLKGLKADKILFGEGGMTDTGYYYREHKVPMMRNLNKDTPDNEFYFTYHHTAGDTVSILNPHDMDRNVIAIASMFYIVADLPIKFPRN